MVKYLGLNTLVIDVGTLNNWLKACGNIRKVTNEPSYPIKSERGIGTVKGRQL